MEVSDALFLQVLSRAAFTSASHTEFIDSDLKPIMAIAYNEPWHTPSKRSLRTLFHSSK